MLQLEKARPLLQHVFTISSCRRSGVCPWCGVGGAYYPVNVVMLNVNKGSRSLWRHMTQSLPRPTLSLLFLSLFPSKVKFVMSIEQQDILPRPLGKLKRPYNIYQSSSLSLSITNTFYTLASIIITSSYSCNYISWKVVQERPKLKLVLQKRKRKIIVMKYSSVGTLYSRINKLRYNLN